MKLEISGKKITLDKAQIEVLKHLNDLQKQIADSLKHKKKGFFAKFFSKESPIKNLYIYGKVGRGKSMLCKYFLENLKTDKKAYFHFNAFMQKIHKELHKLRKEHHHKSSNLVFAATKKVIGDVKVLCFDEMQVEDVADAMILKEVFSYFISHKIAIVTTSNLHPLDLYQNGLQRDLFLKFVKEVLLPNFSVLNLDGKVDYRGKFIDSKRHYFYPINPENKKEIDNIWESLIGDDEIKSKEIETLGRKILVKKSCKNIAFFDFKELCEHDLGIADYAAITAEFSTIFLVNVPILEPEDRNEAKRLIWFVDEAYEKKVKLVILAQTPPEEIYSYGTGHEAFRRTASRLNEL